MSPTLILFYLLFFTAIALLYLLVKFLEARKQTNPDSAAQHDSGINLGR